MKLTSFGFRPSEITATFTPAPLNPSERAVGWDESSDTVPVRLRPSGTSWPFGLLVHAPGMTFATGPLPESLFCDVAVVSAAGAGPAWMVTSGITSATAG